jgi:hypothetical protein
LTPKLRKRAIYGRKLSNAKQARQARAILGADSERHQSGKNRTACQLTHRLIIFIQQSFLAKQKWGGGGVSILREAC